MTAASEPVRSLSWFLPWPAQPYLAVASGSCIQVVSPAEADDDEGLSERAGGVGGKTGLWHAGPAAGIEGGAGSMDESKEVRLKVLWGCGISACTCVEWAPDGALLAASAGAILVLVPRLWSSLLQLAGLAGGLRLRGGMGDRAAKFAVPESVSVSEIGGSLSWPGSEVRVTLREGLLELNKPLRQLQVSAMAVVWQADPCARGLHQGESCTVLIPCMSY